MTNDIQVGYYGVAVKIRGIVLSVVTALCTVLLPRVSYYYKNNKQKEFKRVIEKSVNAILVLAIPFTIFIVLNASKIIHILAGVEFEQAKVPLIIIIPTIIVAGLSNITGIQVLVPMGLERYTIVSTIFGALVDVILNFIYIPQYGPSGAAIGTLMAEIVVLIVQINYLKRYICINIEVINILKIIISALIAVGGLLFFLPQIESVVLNLILCIVVYFGTYGMFLLLFREKMCEQYISTPLKDLLLRRK